MNPIAKAYRRQLVILASVSIALLALLLFWMNSVSREKKKLSTQLHDAALEGSVMDVKQMLTEHPSLVNSRDDRIYGEELRNFLQGQTSPYLLKLPLGVYEEVDDVPISHSDTPLHIAAFLGHSAVVELLLKDGADVNAKAHNGDTPLHEVAAGGIMDSYVIASGDSRGFSNEVFNSNWQVVGDAGIPRPESYKRVAELLLSHGADPNARNNSGLTPLHRAVHSDNDTVAESLLSHGADVNAKDNDGWTPLHLALALKGDHKEMAELLRKHGGHE